LCASEFEKIEELRRQKKSWRDIAKILGRGYETVKTAMHERESTLTHLQKK